MTIDMQALIEEMSILIGKIKSGTATLGELEAFTAAASELHQRSIILRYKAYEAKVYGTPVAVTPEPVQAETPMEVVTEPEAVAEQIIEPQAEPEIEAEMEVEAEISFDLFADSEEEESMDLFSEEPVPVTEETPVVAMHVVSETEAIEEPQEEPIMESSDVVDEEPVSEATPEVELELETKSIEMIEEFTMEAPVVEKEVAPESTAAELADEPVTQDTKGTFSGNEHPVYSRLTMEDNSLAARLMAVRLESLKGAFGFNERLQIIQELFKGSNDAFTQAIEHIDTSSSKSEARMLVSRIAHQFEWDKDSNLALEFVQKVERRFA